MKAGRSNYLDIAKGVGIVLVVIFHVRRGILEAGGNIDSVTFAFADYGTYLFHMPLFFLISGIFVQHSLKIGTVPFLREKLIHIYWPYLLWSTISLLFAALLSSYVNNSIDPMRILSIPLFPKFHFWFLFTLMLYSVLCAFVRDIRVLGVLAVGGALLYLLPQVQVFAGRYVHFLMFFVVGMAMSAQLRAPNPGQYWPVASLMLVVSSVLGFRYGFDGQSPAMIPAALAGSYLVLALAQRIEASPLSSFFRILGEQSLAIYLLHILASSGTRIILSHIMHQPNPYFLLASSVAAGLILPIIAYKLAARLNLLTLSGLGKDRPVERFNAQAST